VRRRRLQSRRQARHLRRRILVRGPDFKEKHPLRKLLVQAPDYLTNNGEHAWDVNGDGWPDIISSRSSTPKSAGTKTRAQKAWPRDLWKKHVLIDTKLSQNEWTEFRDLDGDASRAHRQFMERQQPHGRLQARENEAGEPILKPGSSTKPVSSPTATHGFR